jgi:uncharacterized surface protein with fasciclin (FAS1) repeats
MGENSMNRQALAALAFGAGLAFAHPAAAQAPMMGGAPMGAGPTVVQTAAATPDLSTLVTAVQAAGLGPTLASPGPFTVFAPTNAAFAKLPAGTVQSLVQPAQRATLTSILTYHVVPGRFTSQDILAEVRRGRGRAEFPTAQGGTILVRQSGNTLTITDAKGGRARVAVADLQQSNGVVHVIDSVLMP